jgi:hypothetical protein
MSIAMLITPSMPWIVAGIFRLLFQVSSGYCFGIHLRYTTSTILPL